MASINTYLNFDGNCEEAFNFYKSVFGGEFEMISKFSDMPPNAESQMPESQQDRIMHVTLPIGKNSMLMGSDTGGEWASNFNQGNNFSISINADSKEEADKLFDCLSAGGQATMPMDTTFWDSYFGMLTDKFGVAWMVSYDDPNREK